MLNDVHPPPADINPPPERAEGRVSAHTEPKAPGQHRTRYVGEPTHANLPYAIPSEERSPSVGIAMAVFALLLFSILVVVWMVAW